LFETQVRKVYDRWILPWLSRLLSQRLRRLFLGIPVFLFGYRRILLIRNLSVRERLTLILRFLKIDVNLQNGHQPCEIAAIAGTLFLRRGFPGEIMVEAGCWQGGSSAKFSIMCKMLGYELHVFDSFQGVEETEPDETGFDFSGLYAADKDLVFDNITRFGEIAACRMVPGWFADTLAAQPIRSSVVGSVYIDCDLAKGTFEVLQGVLPALASDGIIFTQDYHIPPVKRLLHDPETWQKLNRPFPMIKSLCHNLARITFEQ